MEPTHLKLIQRRHPEYAELKPHWDFLYDTYIGGRRWFEENIFRYIKEGEQEYKDRVERAYRFNHTREVVDLVVKYLYKAPISRSEDASDAVKAFWKHPGNGQSHSSISQFMRDAATQSGIYGRIYAVVDSTSSSAISRADEKKEGTRTYSYFVSPQRALDMSFDQHGDLNWILFQEDFRDDEDPFSGDDDHDVRIRFRLWTRDEWFLITPAVNGDGTLSLDTEAKFESGTHGLGVVPVVIVDHITSDESLYSAPSMISDVAYLDRACANYLSNLDAIIQDQTFSQLVIPAQSLPFSLDGGVTATQRAMIEMGTKRIFTYDASNGAPAPAYISPDVKQSQLLMSVVKQIINEIYHSVGVAGERTKQDNSMGIDNSSGVAKAYDFDRVNSLLTAKSMTLSQVENRIAQLVDLWAGNDPQDDLVQYPKDFDVRGLADEFEVAANLNAIEAPDVVRRQQMEQLVEKLFPSIKATVKKQMIAEIADWPVNVSLVMPQTSIGTPKAERDDAQETEQAS
jgi:hypothetical protein